MTKLRIAIVGCNNMGKKHLDILRKYFGDEVEMVGILNSTPESSARKATELGVAYFNSLDEITRDNVDAAIVATPGILHAEIGSQLLARGIPCLMEKPLAHNEAGCKQLMDAAKIGNGKIIAGHTENYNPAVMRLKQELKAPVKRISGIRTSANNGNSAGITAVQELMIHDLAIVLSLLGNDIKTASIHKNPKHTWGNHAIVDICYNSGAEVKIEALRDSEHPVERQMEIEDADGNIFDIKFREKQLRKNSKLISDNEGDTLVLELGNFINVLKGKEDPAVSAEEATDILKLCLRLEKEISNQDKLAALAQQNTRL